MFWNIHCKAVSMLCCRLHTLYQMISILTPMQVSFSLNLWCMSLSSILVSQEEVVLHAMCEMVARAFSTHLKYFKQCVAMCCNQSSQFLVAAIELSMAIRELGMMKLEGSEKEGHDETSSDSEELHRMAAKGQTAILKKLVTGGADVSKPDFDGRTPLVSTTAY